MPLRALLKRSPGAALAGVLLSGSTPSSGTDDPPLLLFRTFSPERAEHVEPDPAFPRGARVFARRPTATATSCSPSRPVCVHGEDPALGASALSALEDAFDRIVLVLGAPAPLPDQGGPTPALDLYLQRGGEALLVHAEPPLGRQDSSAAFCVAEPTGFDPSTAARCVAEAVALRLDAAETPALRRGLSTYLSWLSVGPDERSLAAVERAQAKPQVSLSRRDLSPLADASALFFAHLELAHGSGRPAEAALALFTQSRSDARSSGLDWENEPDLFDVLRAATEDDAARFADLAIDFAISRLFLGDRADGQHVPGAPWLGTFGRVGFDWSVSFASLPRNLAAARPLEPMGSAYVWLDARDMPESAELVATFSFEAPVRFRFSVVAIDAQGRELERFDVPFFSKGTQVERTVMKPRGCAGFVFVVMNLGGVHADFPFDPDHEPWEPHGYELYLAAL